MRRPACMNDEDFEGWVEANNRLLLMYRAESPCRDCTWLYHRDMVAGGMCDGHPETLDPRDAPAPVPPPEILSQMRYADLKAIRLTHPKIAPRDLSEALYRARQREYRRAVRMRASA